MSIKTTHLVTREFAIKAIKIKAALNEHNCKQRIKDAKQGKKLNTLDNDELEYVLEEAIHNGFYNFTIVSKDYLEENKSDKYGSPSLDNLFSLPPYNNAY
jgi:hypothetical protein